jgi:phosphohistidine swiveling domain-containing protein
MIEYRDKKSLDTSTLMKIRKHTEYFMPGLIATIRNTFKHLAPKHKEFVDVILIDEILNTSFPPKEVLKARTKTFAYTDGKLFDSINEVKAVYGIEIKKEGVFVGNELRGQTAYPGKVQGVVKIIKTRADMGKFKDKDIIVSPTTTPDFLPIMKIPCVVGVKDATKILKDDDTIEVDADLGVIKILKK